MDFSQNHVQSTLVLLSLLFFLVPSFFTQQQPCLVQGMSLPQQNKVQFTERALIGSSPPKCQGRCNHCGPCEAIQVPLVPQKGFPRNHFLHSTPNIAYSRGDSLSNYKPMGWKCKCGNSIFEP